MASPATSFTIPFPTPTLRWACRKRLRCVNPSKPSPERADPAPEWQRPRTPRKEEAAEGDGRFLRSRAGGGEKKKVELWVSLSREEIEEDFYSFTGAKLPRRPRKRAKSVPGHLLDSVFPGAWLPNAVTLEMYKVHEPTDSRRR